MKILHLYHDLLNLYGEYANVSVLQRYLTQEGLDAAVTKASLYDEIDFSAFDFIYIGSGTERKQLLALDDLQKRADPLRKAYENGAVILATGNAFELFGKTLTSPDGVRHDCLGWFDYTTVVTDQKRTLADQICTFQDGRKAVGFINKASEIFDVTSPLFTVDFGEGNHAGDRTEGFMAERFFGTHLTGPCLVKNPFLALFFVQLLCEKAGTAYKPLALPNETKAYQITLDALSARFSK